MMIMHHIPKLLKTTFIKLCPQHVVGQQTASWMCCSQICRDRDAIMSTWTRPKRWFPTSGKISAMKSWGCKENKLRPCLPLVWCWQNAKSALWLYLYTFVQMHILLSNLFKYFHHLLIHSLMIVIVMVMVMQQPRRGDDKVTCRKMSSVTKWQLVRPAYEHN